MRSLYHTANLFFAFAFAFYCQPTFGDDWPQFRGANSQSNAGAIDLPLEWSVKDGANIAWQADLPGTGVSSPIVVEGRVIITAASGPNRDRLHVMAFDEATGKSLWHRQFWATGRTFCYETSSVAAGTPASDGRHVFALFSSNDLVAFDLDGNLMWMRSLATEHPQLGNDIGMASSPVVAAGAVVVQCECQQIGLAAAFDVQTGATLWKVERPARSNWASPTVVALAEENKGDSQAVLMQSGSDLSLYDVKTGNVIWTRPAECATIASATPAGDSLVIPAGGLTSLNPTGDDAPVVRWTQGSLNIRSASLAVGDGRLYAIGRGVLKCADLETGETLWKKRLKGTFWATPLLAGNHLYCVSQQGTAFVVDVTDKGKVLAENSFGTEIYGSPIATGQGLFVRSNSTLWKIATLQQASLNQSDQQ